MDRSESPAQQPADSEVVVGSGSGYSSSAVREVYVRGQSEYKYTLNNGHKYGEHRL